MILFYLLGFTSNADATNLLFLGKGIETWLNYTLLFFGLTSIAFAWVWLSGLIVIKKSDDFIDEDID